MSRLLMTANECISKMEEVDEGAKRSRNKKATSPGQKCLKIVWPLSDYTENRLQSRFLGK